MEGLARGVVPISATRRLLQETTLVTYGSAGVSVGSVGAGGLGSIPFSLVSGVPGFREMWRSRTASVSEPDPGDILSGCVGKARVRLADARGAEAHAI